MAESESDSKPPEEVHDSCSIGGGELEDATALTLLWGTWELWADVPSTTSATHHPFSTPLAEERVRTGSVRGSSVGVGGGSASASPPLTQGIVDSAPSSTLSPSGVTETENWLDKVKSVGLLDSVEGFWGVYDCILLPSQLPPNSSYYFFRKHIAPMWEHEANRRGGKWMITFTANAPSVGPPAPGGEEFQTNGAGEKIPVPMAPVDIAWQKLCLACIGELFPGEEEEICGVTATRSKVRGGSTAANAVSTGAAAGMNLLSSNGAGGVGPSSLLTGAGSSGEWKLCVWTRNAEDRDTQMQIAAFMKELLELPPTTTSGIEMSNTFRNTDRRTSPNHLWKESKVGEANTDYHSNSASGSSLLAVQLNGTPPTDFSRSKANHPSNHSGAGPQSYVTTGHHSSTGSTKPVLVYMAHRDLMQAKQNYAKGGSMSSGLKPRYFL